MTNKKGFTLIELLVYIAVLSFVATFLSVFVLNLIGTQTKIRIGNETLENSQRAMEIMLWEIKHAQSIYVSTSNFGAHPGRLSVKTGLNAPEGEETTYVDFYLDENNRLCLKREGTEAEAITSENIKINNLVFSHLKNGDSELIQINLSSTYNQPVKEIYSPHVNLISSAAPRNE